MILLLKLLFVMTNVIIDISEKLLNKMQAVINKFIWNKATSRLKLAITEKALKDGGVPIPNVKTYYSAACLVLVACTDWWGWPSDDINQILEQDKCGVNFADWMVSDLPVKQDLKLANRTAKMLGKMWIKYKNIWISCV